MISQSAFEDSAAYKQLQRKTRELQKKEYLPQELVSLMTAITRIQLEIEDSIRFSGCAQDGGTAQPEQRLPAGLPLSSAARHAQGEPVLLRENFPLDHASLSVIAHKIFEVLPSVSAELAAHGEALQTDLASGVYSLDEACRSIVSTPVSLDEKSYFYRWAREHPDAPFFFSFIAASCVMPSAKAAARLLAEHHDGSQNWLFGHCPVCGSLPLLGRFVQTEGFRLHTCSFCLHEYRSSRMACPFCLSTGGEKDHYFVSEDEPGYELHVCDECKSYCKIADFRQFDRFFMPMLDDLESLVLDIYARKHGYKRPTLSIWGF